VLFPEPEGAEMMKRIPATFDFPSNSFAKVIFRVLNLFAGLFDL